VSYRNIYYNTKERCVTLFTWDKDGKRIKVDASVDPYLYVEGAGNDESIYGTRLNKKSFRTQYDRYKYLKDTNVKRVFDNFPIVQQYLIDSFWKDNEKPEFAQHPIKVMFVDIEVYAPDDFPHANEAKAPVNVITVYDTLSNKFVTWGIKDYNTTEPDVKYVKCVSEADIFKKFIEYFESDYPDILTGWNSEFFDIPYIINRCTKVLDKSYTDRLSPSNNVYSREMKGKFGQEQTRWYIEGISLIDYLDVYKRFSAGERESYKLASIAEAELGEGKVDFGTMNLATLADTDWKTFIDYNIQDVRLLVKLEEKLKYSELIRMLAYVGLTTFEGAMGSLSVINGATAVRARYRNQRIPSFIRDADDGSKNPGAYVGAPLSGFQECVISFDANSLYPNVMISLNISPETKVGVIEDKNDKEVTIRHVSGKVYSLPIAKFASFIETEEIAISKANVMFSQKKKGVMPEILDFYYNKRQAIRKDIKKLKKQHSELEDKETKDAKQLKMIIDQLDAKQLCIKVFINSIYGYFGNKNAPFGDDDVASSITLTGQSVIKHSNELLKSFIKNEISSIDDELLNKCIIYNDTDSSYVSIKPLFIDKVFKKGNKLTKEAYDTVNRIEEYLNNNIKTWGAKALNSKDCRFIFKREAIADVGIFLQKKRYVLHILDDEGIPCDKFKYTGVEVVRSTMPKAVKPYVKKIIETMLQTQNIGETNKLINETYEIFKTLTVEDIALVSGIKGYEKFAGQCDGFTTTKGMPCHVKAAYYYNILLDKFKLGQKYEKISSGDKVRYFYLAQPNKYNIQAIGYKYYYPEEFKKLFEADYETMFESHIFSVVERFYENVNWSAQKPGSLVQTNLFELFA
jgi:DNA polymerase elongation subunit (family B)